MGELPVAWRPAHGLSSAHCGELGAMIMAPTRLLVLCLAFLWPAGAFAREVNVTIDDTMGDARTGERPRYVPQDWNPRSVGGAPCQRCTANPDPTLAFSGTWHDKTTHIGDEPSTVAMDFSGTAVYVFCIIANGLGRTSNTTRLSFFLDDLTTPIGSFLHELDTTRDNPYYLYNQPVFSARSLNAGNHTFLVANVAGDTGSLVLFDYVVYTTEEPDPSDSEERTPESTTSSTPSVPSSSTTPEPAAHNRTAVIGGAVGGGLAAALALLALAYCFYHRRKKAARAQGFVRPFESPLPQERHSGGAASPPAMRGVRESWGLRSEMGRIREEIARVRRLAEPPEYPGPSGSSSLGRHASSSGRAGRAKIIMAAVRE